MEEPPYIFRLRIIAVTGITGRVTATIMPIFQIMDFMIATIAE
jgi:hypothetical protein